jgi:hypothetical protein
MNEIRTSMAMIVAAALISMPSNAYEFEARTLEKLFLHSSAVAQVEILSSDIFTVEQESATVDCGNVYTAKVIRSYKGGALRVRFATAARLSIRSKYVVFLAKEFRDGAIKFTSMGAKQDDKYHACLLGGVELYASLMHGEIYQIEYSPDSGDKPDAIRAVSVNKPFDGVVPAERIEVSSPKLSVEDLDALSYWHVPWSSFEAQLLILAQER